MSIEHTHNLQEAFETQQALLRLPVADIDGLTPPVGRRIPIALDRVVQHRLASTL